MRDYTDYHFQEVVDTLIALAKEVGFHAAEMARNIPNRFSSRDYKEAEFLLNEAFVNLNDARREILMRADGLGTQRAAPQRIDESEWMDYSVWQGQEPESDSGEKD